MDTILIKRLKKEDLPPGKTVSFTYTSDKYYELSVSANNGWQASLTEKHFEKPFTKSLCAEIFEPEKGKLECYTAELDGSYAGIISFSLQDWNNVLRIWDLYVDERAKRKGIGTALIKIAKEKALALGARAVVLETQTSNFYAIEFYKAMGFKLIGFDSISYSNSDIERNDVRIEMGYIIK